MSFYQILAVTIIATIATVFAIGCALQFIRLRLTVRWAEAASVAYHQHPAPTTARAAAELWLEVSAITENAYVVQRARDEYRYFIQSAEERSHR